MKTFLISFLIEDNSLSQQCIEKIKQFGAWARITPTTWCIKIENQTVAGIRDSLSQMLDNKDRIFVADISNSSWASYYLPQEVASWLKN